MRFTLDDFSKVRPVLDYPLPLYPTKAQAQKLGIDLYRLPEPVWLRYGRRALAGAILLSITSNSSCIACIRERHPSYLDVPEAQRYLTEAEARQIIMDAFTAEGVSFTEDYQYTTAEVDFNADGFNDAEGIGFEYHSIDDLELYRTLIGDQAARDGLFLDYSEDLSLELQMSAGGDAVKKFTSGISYSLEEEATKLQQQVQEFIDWLKANGKL